MQTNLDLFPLEPDRSLNRLWIPATYAIAPWNELDHYYLTLRNYYLQFSTTKE